MVERGGCPVTRLSTALRMLLALAIAIGTAAPAAGANKDRKCGCPVIAPVATSARPDPRKIQNELSFTALEMMFSNRAARFGGSWDKALLALAHEIDPGGALRIWKAPAPAPSAPAFHVDEGNFSKLLISGVPPAPYRGGNPWRNVMNPEFISVAIIETIARSNKYGEPAFRLRETLLRAGRFLAEDLAGVPPDAERQDPRARQIAAVAYQSRSLLMSYLEALQSAGDGSTRPVSAALQLDDADLANAALDLVLSVDDKGRREGLFSFRKQDGVRLIDALLRLAAMRPVFGGPAPPNSPLDAVGCKAHSILVALADAGAPHGAAFRAELWLTLSAQTTGPPTPLVNAARSVLILAGFATAKEAADAMDLLFRMADMARRDDQAVARAVTLEMMRALEAFAGGPGRDTFRAAAGARGTVIFEDFQKRQDAGAGGPTEQRVIKEWAAAKAGWRPRMAAALCAPDATPPRVYIFAKGRKEPIVVKHFYQEVPLRLGVFFDEPYEHDSYPVTVSVGGRRLELTATPSGDDRTRFYTEFFFVAPR